MINKDNRAVHYFDGPASKTHSVKSTFQTIGRNLLSVLYEPGEMSEKTAICILVMHSDISYLDFAFGQQIAGWGYDADTVYGIDWDSSYNCTPGNIVGIHVPLLVMGMTGSWEYSAAETIAERATSEDVTLAYVKGAQHFFNTAKELEAYPGQFGDTMQTTCRFVDAWLTDKLMRG